MGELLCRTIKRASDRHDANLVVITAECAYFGQPATEMPKTCILPALTLAFGRHIARLTRHDHVIERLLVLRQVHW